MASINVLRKALIASGLAIFSCCALAQPVSTTEDWERREILVESGEIVNIQQVLNKGRWTNDGFDGPLKFLITEESNGTNKLYVQWIEEESGEIAYTVSVREFNSLPEFSLGLPTCLTDDCTVSKISAVHVYEEVPQTFVLNLVALGRYSVGLFNQ